MKKNKENSILDLITLMAEVMRDSSIKVEDIVDNYVTCATPRSRQMLINKLKEMRKLKYGIEEDKVVLHLTLKKKWYDMIDSGEKLEEYRDITSYWRSRLLENRYPRRYTHVLFRCGYTSKTMMFRYDGLHVGYGKAQWGAPPYKEVFVIRLGQRC